MSEYENLKAQKDAIVTREQTRIQELQTENARLRSALVQIAKGFVDQAVKIMSSPDVPHDLKAQLFKSTLTDVAAMLEARHD